MYAPSCLLTVALAAASTSCSFISLNRVPDKPTLDDVLDCTDEMTSPLIDMTASVLSGVLAIALVSGEKQGSSTSISGYVTGGVSLSFAAAAIFGAFHVNRCKTAKAIDAAENPTQQVDTEKPAAGRLGGSCQSDDDCSIDNRCDPTMKLCVASSEND